MDTDAPATDTVAALHELESGIDALRAALVGRDADAVAQATGHLEETINHWPPANGDALPAEAWRERAFALRMKNMHNGRLLLADLNWIGAVMRWLQHDGAGDTYAANGARLPATPARTLDFRG